MTAPVVHSDALVVGAGSAGAIVAERLSSDPSCIVTVLEAGVGLVDPDLAMQAANGRRLPIGPGSRLVRRYEAALTARDPRPAAIMRGSTLGGSGAVNGGYFCRGMPADFDTWPPGWSWPEVLTSFRAIETDLDFSGDQHGGRGPIPVQRTTEMCDGTKAFVESVQRRGFGWISDLNDATMTSSPGVGAVPLNIVDGVRNGPGAAYLLPALDRPNLAVLTETQAVRVEIERDRARAVHAIGPAGPIRLTANRIVLCAGAIESAHLLMLSGIGEEAMLRQAGVAVRAALPVGRHCADHPEWLVAADWPGTPDRPPLEAVLCDDDLEIRPYTAGFAAMIDDGWPARPPEIGVALMTPRARGRLTLVSDDPRVPPRIEHRYDTEPDDVAALRRGVDLVAQLRGMRPGAAEPRWSTSQHFCSSAPMGSYDDDTAVLDNQCRVRGIEGLWVIDGSALPRVPSRGPHATIAMLAHRAVEFVRGQGCSR
ncbi:mycofactocin dehydrogenase MftG [Mycolicibacter sinensis]|uniref:Glucose-methanol-choline oxidoreductase n=1 Tax=Mycolicibacter sinensis (strain JDM601) TaxID=875328 RepID=A0A1A3U629_MYCSD|nr:mycofactocin system GMC family oxidoreductase MftG [Mycolicibacter sinensis]OBK90365.1 glucose-methanol-choline oxidoreductase [Mycolicibacter sinensis]